MVVYVVYGGSWWFTVIYGGILWYTWRYMVVFGGMWWCRWWGIVIDDVTWWSMVICDYRWYLPSCITIAVSLPEGPAAVAYVIFKSDVRTHVCLCDAPFSPPLLLLLLYHCQHIHYKQIYGARWWHLVTHDDIWWYMVVYGGRMWYMVIDDDIWWHMLIYGGIWWYMVYKMI